ncbi:hypothetical protein ILUMI_12832, partial [Ignelater luminosus]
DYIELLAKKFNIVNAKPIGTPLKYKISLDKGSKDVNKNIPYQCLIGSLRYLAVNTRPDIAFSVAAFLLAVAQLSQGGELPSKNTEKRGISSGHFGGVSDIHGGGLLGGHGGLGGGIDEGFDGSGFGSGIGGLGGGLGGHGDGLGGGHFGPWAGKFGSGATSYSSVLIQRLSPKSRSLIRVPPAVHTANKNEVGAALSTVHISSLPQGFILDRLNRRNEFFTTAKMFTTALYTQIKSKLLKITKWLLHPFTEAILEISNFVKMSQLDSSPTSSELATTVPTGNGVQISPGNGVAAASSLGVPAGRKRPLLTGGPRTSMTPTKRTNISQDENLPNVDQQSSEPQTSRYSGSLEDGFNQRVFNVM